MRYRYSSLVVLSFPSLLPLFFEFQQGPQDAQHPSHANSLTLSGSFLRQKYSSESHCRVREPRPLLVVWPESASLSFS
jgi:hypothetical protein